MNRVFFVIALAMTTGCGDAQFVYYTCDECASHSLVCVPKLNRCIEPNCDMGCDMTTQMCTSSVNCSDQQPICGTQKFCRPCTGTADDAECKTRNAATPYCNVEIGQCAQCRPNISTTDCSGTMPICAQNGSCRKCASHDECSLGICKGDGGCATADEIAYVNNAVTCSDTAHDSTSSNPYCQISAAIKNSGKPVIKVLGGNSAYASVSITSGSFTILAGNAEISGDLTNPAIAVSGATTNVAIEGIKVKAGGSGQHGIACSSTSSPGPTLAIRQSIITGVGGAGVSANQCNVTIERSSISTNQGTGITISNSTVTIDRSTIGPSNSGGGIKLTDSKYSISNSFIVANGLLAPGVSLLGTSSGTFAFNTVAKNQVNAGTGGIDCGGGETRAIENSIIWGNIPSNTGPACMLVKSVTTPAMDPNFKNATGPNFDFHLDGTTPANLACCIDQIDSSPVDHDFDGTKRPQGTKWDVGAHEIVR